MITRLTLLCLAACFSVVSAVAQRADIIVITVLHDDGTKTVSTRKISERVMEQLTYSARGVVTMKRLFRMDRNGKVRSGLAWDGGGNFLFRFQYAFDDLDRLSREEVYDKANTMVRVMETKYDPKGKPVRRAFNQAKMAKNVDPKLLEHPERLRGKKVPGDQSGAVKPR